MFYPLGGNVFASVCCRNGDVNIVIRLFKKPTNTKGGKMLRSQKAIYLNLKSFERLWHVRSKLVADYQQLTASLCESAIKKSQRSAGEKGVMSGSGDTHQQQPLQQRERPQPLYPGPQHSSSDVLVQMEVGENPLTTWLQQQREQQGRPQQSDKEAEVMEYEEGKGKGSKEKEVMENKEEEEEDTRDVSEQGDRPLPTYSPNNQACYVYNAAKGLFVPHN